MAEGAEVITRDAAHRYTYEGVQYPGVTSILGVMDKSAALMNWAARQTAEAAVDMVLGPVDEPMGYPIDAQPLTHLLTTVGREGTIKALKELNTASLVTKADINQALGEIRACTNSSVPDYDCA